MEYSYNKLMDLLKDQYKINISDDDYNRLKMILCTYNVNPSSIRIEVENNRDNFINNIHLIKKAIFRRNHVEFELEEVLFMLDPIAYGSDEYFDTNYPKRVCYKKTRECELKEYENITQNIALVRNFSLISRENAIISEHFTLMIYNKDLNVIAGIIFEKLDPDENKTT